MTSKYILILAIIFSFVNFAKAQIIPKSDGEYAEEEISIDFTDAQVAAFSQVRESITSLQLQTEKVMEEALKAEGMPMQEITDLTTRQGESVQSGTKLTEKEAKKLAKANEEMQRIQLEMQPRILQAIEDEGLTMEEYKNLLQAYRTNDSFKKRVRSISSH